MNLVNSLNCVGLAPKRLSMSLRGRATFTKIWFSRDNSIGSNKFSSVTYRCNAMITSRSMSSSWSIELSLELVESLCEELELSTVDNGNVGMPEAMSIGDAMSLMEGARSSLGQSTTMAIVGLRLHPRASTPWRWRLRSSRRGAWPGQSCLVNASRRLYFAHVPLTRALNGLHVPPPA